jgi:hypothetical protein
MIEEMETEGLQLQKKKQTLREKIQYFRAIIDRSIMVPIICLGIHQFGGDFMDNALYYTLDRVGYSYGANMLIFGVAQFFGGFPISTRLLMECPAPIPYRASRHRCSW